MPKAQIFHSYSEPPQKQLQPKALLKCIKKCFEYYNKKVNTFEKAEIYKGHKAKVKNITKYCNTLREYTAYDTKTIVVIIRYPDYDSNRLLEGYDWQVQYCDDIYRRKGMDFDRNELLKWFDDVYCKDVAPAMSDAFGFLQNYGPTKELFVKHLNSLPRETRDHVLHWMELGEMYGEKRNWPEVFKSWGI